MSQTIALDDLLTRDLTVAWFESVALLQSVCRVVVADGRGNAFPAASSILLGADGGVSISGLWSEGSPVEAAARLLSDMTGSDVPVQLRLMMSQAAAPASPYGTLEDFSRALAYFERSEPQQILRALHERAARMPPRPSLLPHAAGSAFQAAPPTPAKTAPAKKRQQAPLVAGLATAAGLSVVAWVSGGLPAMGHTANLGFSFFENTIRAKLGAAPADAPAPAKDAAPVAVEKERAASARPAPAPLAASTASRPRRTPDSGRSISPPGLAALPVVPRLAPPELFALRPGREATPRFYSSVDILADAAFVRPASGHQGPIYSSRDQAVVPPRAIYPVLPAAPPPGASLEGKTIVDLVIDPTGTVEGVRLRTTPRNIHEFMLLSAAKAWRFDPAVHQDGRPVWFRHSVVLTALP